MNWWIVGLSGFVGLCAGYLLGWRAGHLAGIRYTLGLVGMTVSPAPEDVVAEYTKDVMAWNKLDAALQDAAYHRWRRAHNIPDGPIARELWEDEEYQALIREQADDGSTA